MIVPSAYPLRNDCSNKEFSTTGRAVTPLAADIK
jgi:hypothetical protein